MQLQIKLEDGAILPERAHYLDAGMDLFTREDMLIQPGETAVFDTGVHILIPEGYFGKIESKSGLYFKQNIACLCGVIDSGYTGSVCVKLINLSKDMAYLFNKGDKIAQIIIQPCVLDIEFTELIDESSERSSNGFGSTGR